MSMDELRDPSLRLRSPINNETFDAAAKAPVKKPS